MRIKFNRKTKGETIFDLLNVIVMCIICFVTVYPIWYTLVNSLNDAADAVKGGIYWWPRIISVENYKTVFRSPGITTAMIVTVAKTILGTVTHVFFTAMVAYAFSKKELIGRKIYIGMGIVTMFFSGGLIPSYLLLRELHLLDNFFVYIIPTMFSFFNLVIFMSFFRGIPNSLEESARIDGAYDFMIFIKIILPVSLPVLATIALFQGVFQWNDYFSGVMYITRKTELVPIQTYLYKIITQTGANSMMANMPDNIAKNKVSSQSIKLATMVVTTFPIVCVYPFLQKYFVKGMLIGAVKG